MCIGYAGRGLTCYKFFQGFQELNLIYCELTSLLVLRRSSLHSQKAPNRTPKANDNKLMQVGLVSDYIINLLHGEGTTTSEIPHFLSAGSYRALLPSIWAIINSDLEVSSHATDVTQALLDHANKTSSKSGPKRLTIEVVARLMLVSQFLPPPTPSRLEVFLTGYLLFIISSRQNRSIKAYSELEPTVQYDKKLKIGLSICPVSFGR